MLVLGVARGQHRVDREFRDRPVRQQRGHVDGVVPGVGARSGQRSGVAAADPVHRHLLLGALLLGADGVGQHQGAEDRGDEEGPGRFEGDDVAVDDLAGEPRDAAARGGDPGAQPDGLTRHDAAQPADERDEEAQGDHRGQEPVPADRLYEGVGGADAHQHEDEQEEHQHGAGVDDDLHDHQERRLVDPVEDGEADHHHGHHERGVDSPAAEHYSERGEHHDGAQDVEGRGLTAANGGGRCLKRNDVH